ncbi:MAG: hypothetical protein U0531_08025 [Dehalococcoidia bacterium]
MDEYQVLIQTDTTARRTSFRTKQVDHPYSPGEWEDMKALRDAIPGMQLQRRYAVERVRLLDAAGPGASSTTCASAAPSRWQSRARTSAARSVTTSSRRRSRS